MKYKEAEIVMGFTFGAAGLELKLPGTNSCALGLSFKVLVVEIDEAAVLLLLLLLAAVDLVVESASLILIDLVDDFEIVDCSKMLLTDVILLRCRCPVGFPFFWS